MKRVIDRKNTINGVKPRKFFGIYLYQVIRKFLSGMKFIKYYDFDTLGQNISSKMRYRDVPLVRVSFLTHPSPSQGYRNQKNLKYSRQGVFFEKKNSHINRFKSKNFEKSVPHQGTKFCIFQTHAGSILKSPAACPRSFSSSGAPDFYFGSPELFASFHGFALGGFIVIARETFYRHFSREENLIFTC